MGLLVIYHKSNLNKQDRMKEGDVILCPRCKEKHDVSIDKDDAEVLLYNCNGEIYLAGLFGRSIMYTEPDIVLST